MWWRARPNIAETARIGRIFADPALRVHWGTVLAFVVAFLVWWLLWKTTRGFEIRTVGMNPDAARYARRQRRPHDHLDDVPVRLLWPVWRARLK